MPLYTVDVYSNSSDNIIRDPHAQGVIVKATQGQTYVNPKCNHQWDLAGQLGKKRGLYHYAGGGNPVVEAQFFINNIKNYVGQGILILDWESYQNSAWGNTNWVRQFVDEVHRLTGVYPVIYVQESALWQVANCADVCGVWVAKYASMNWNSWILPQMYVSAGVFKVLTGWQFTGGDMDRSIWYINEAGWDRLASPNGQVQSTAKGHLDSVSIAKGKMHVSGWFASNDTDGKDHSFAILTTEDVHTEFARAAVTKTSRPDVAKAYPALKSAGQSGFDAELTLPKSAIGQKVRVIFRHTDDPVGNGNAVDWSTVIDLGKSAAALDATNVEQYKNQLQVSGWFASDWSLALPYQFVILYDQTDKKEVQRVRIKPVKRDDVAKAHPDIYGTQTSGFNEAFDYDGSLANHDLQVVARFSDDQASGEGHKVDYWFPTFKGPDLPILDGKQELVLKARTVAIESTKDGVIVKLK